MKWKLSIKEGIYLKWLFIYGALLIFSELCYSKTKTLNIKFTSVPPVIDGKIEDVCWKDAEIGGNFCAARCQYLYSKDDTEVRAVYDCENLYILFVCHHSKINSLRRFEVGSGHDVWMGNWSDEVEIFLMPSPDEHFYFQFCVDCENTQFEALWDSKGKGGKDSGPTWTEPWVSAVKRYEKAYVVEIAIPFSSLLREGYITQAPTYGAVWRGQFSRMTSYNNYEPSSWSGGDESKINTMFGFHNKDDFGYLVFLPPKDLSIIKIENINNPNWGYNSLRVKQLSSLVDIKAEISIVNRDKNKILWKNVEYIKNNDFTNGEKEILYLVNDGGRNVLDVKIYSYNDQLLQHMRIPFSIPDYYGIIQNIFSEVRFCKDTLNKYEKIEKNLKDNLLIQIDDLETRNKEINKRLETLLSQKEISSDEWNKFNKELSELETIKNRIVKETINAALISCSNLKKPWAGIGWDNPLNRYSPDDIFRGNLNGPAKIVLCKNEYRGIQLIIIPFRNLKHVSVTPWIFKCEENGMELPLGSVTCEVVGFIKVPEIGASDKPGSIYIPSGYFPDPLMKVAQDFELNTGKIQPIYVRVYVPKGALPGIYKGNIFISAEGEEVISFPVEIHVLDFTLPDKHSIPCWPCGPDSLSYWYYYGYFYKGHHIRKFMGIEEFKKYADFMKRYRCDISLPIFTYFINQLVSVEYLGKKNGIDQFKYDFTLLEPYLKIIFESNTKFFNVSTINESFISYNFVKFTALDKKTGKIIKFDYKDYKSDESTEALLQFIEQFVNYLKKKGWYDPDYTVYYGFDECYGERIPHMQKVHQKIKDRIPYLKRTYSGSVPYAEFNKGYIDIWIPHLSDDIPKWAPEERKKGKGIWCYVCGGATSINIRLTTIRLMFWLMYKWGIKGHISYAFNGWVSEGIRDIMPWEYWPKSDWQIKGNSNIIGDAYKVYPSPDGGEPWSSLRMESIRDGIQDYEYFVLGEKIFNKLIRSKKVDKKFIKEFSDLLKIPEDICPDYTHLSSETFRIEEYRINLGYAIEKAIHLLNLSNSTRGK